jgi:hypothetical protein
MRPSLDFEKRPTRVDHIIGRTIDDFATRDTRDCERTWSRAHPHVLNVNLHHETSMAPCNLLCSTRKFLPRVAKLNCALKSLPALILLAFGPGK